MVREALYRGGDDGVVLTDRPLGGADTLATSYSLAQTIRHLPQGYDIIIGGRQAIDGDTAQVGPQVAEKLGLNQITYVEEILEVKSEELRVKNKSNNSEDEGNSDSSLFTLHSSLIVKRHIDGGVETVESPLPCVLTVNGSAAPCRPRNVKRVMKYKRCLAPMELPQGQGFGDLPYAAEYEKKPYLKLGQLSCADVNADLQQCGLAGSPTKVKNVENIVFKAKESKVLTGSDEDVNGLIKELLNERLIG